MEITKLKIKQMNLLVNWESNNWNFTQIHIVLMLVEIVLVASVCIIIYRRVSHFGCMTIQQVQQSFNLRERRNNSLSESSQARQATLESKVSFLCFTRSSFQQLFCVLDLQTCSLQIHAGDANRTRVV